MSDETQDIDAGAEVEDVSAADADDIVQSLLSFDPDSASEEDHPDSEVEATESEEAGDDGDGASSTQSAEGEQEQQQEISPLQKRFTNEDGTFDSTGALKALEELGSLHSQTAKNFAEQRAYSGALEKRLGLGTEQKQAAGLQEKTQQEVTEQAKPKVKLPENYNGTLNQDDMETLTDAIVNTLSERMRQEQTQAAEQQRQIQSQEAEAELEARATGFITATRGLYDNFRGKYGVPQEAMDQIHEVLKGDPELAQASEAFVKGQGNYPEELLTNKIVQAYGQLTQKTQQQQTQQATGGVNADAIVETVLKKLGIEPAAEAARQQVNNVSRETEHPLKAVEIEGDDGEDDDVSAYFRSQGMEVDPELLGILRDMSMTVPN